MPGQPQRLNHPWISYVLGFVVMVPVLIVAAGVIHHLTVSHHGPGLLVPAVKKYEESKRSEIMDEARRHEEQEKHEHFHTMMEYPDEVPERLHSVCHLCHSDYPHGKNKRVRALMNMHTQYLVCETCHLKEEPGVTVVHKWYNPLGGKPVGAVFGTSYDPETGALIKGSDPFSRIAPYVSRGSRESEQGILPILLQDSPLAQDYIKVKDKLSPAQREGIKNQFHVNIKPKGHDCLACHTTEKGLLDFNQLGFSETRTSNLQRLGAKDMLSKYQRFYLPELLIDQPARDTKAP